MARFLNITPTYNPFTMDEMLKVPLLYDANFREVEKQYDELQDKAALLRLYAKDSPEIKAAIDKYDANIQSISNAIASGKYDSNMANQARAMRETYRKDIIPMSVAAQQYENFMQSYLKDMDGTEIGEKPSIKWFMEHPGSTPEVIHGSAIQNQLAKLIGTYASTRQIDVTNPNNWTPIMGGQYLAGWSGAGYTNKEIADYLNNPTNSNYSNINNIVNNFKQNIGYDKMTPEQKVSADSYINTAIQIGMAGNRKYERVQNRGYKSGVVNPLNNTANDDQFYIAVLSRFVNGEDVPAGLLKEMWEIMDNETQQYYWSNFSTEQKERIKALYQVQNGGNLFKNGGHIYQLGTSNINSTQSADDWFKTYQTSRNPKVSNNVIRTTDPYVSGKSMTKAQKKKYIEETIKLNQLKEQSSKSDVPAIIDGNPIPIQYDIDRTKSSILTDYNKYKEEANYTTEIYNILPKLVDVRKKVDEELPSLTKPNISQYKNYPNGVPSKVAQQLDAYNKREEARNLKIQELTKGMRPTQSTNNLALPHMYTSNSSDLRNYHSMRDLVTTIDSYSKHVNKYASRINKKTNKPASITDYLAAEWLNPSDTFIPVASKRANETDNSYTYEQMGKHFVTYRKNKGSQFEGFDKNVGEGNYQDFGYTTKSLSDGYFIVHNKNGRESQLPIAHSNEYSKTGFKVWMNYIIEKYKNYLNPEWTYLDYPKIITYLNNTQPEFQNDVRILSGYINTEHNINNPKKTEPTATTVQKALTK